MFECFGDGLLQPTATGSITGTLADGRVKIHNTLSSPAGSLDLEFDGRLSGTSMSGDISILGEGAEESNQPVELVQTAS